jgi:hypothetical protein
MLGSVAAPAPGDTPAPTIAASPNPKATASKLSCDRTAFIVSYYDRSIPAQDNCDLYRVFPGVRCSSWMATPAAWAGLVAEIRQDMLRATSTGLAFQSKSTTWISLPMSWRGVA